MTFLAQLAADDLAALGALGGIRVFENGDVLLAEGAPGTEVYVIVRGFAKVVNHTPDGHQSLVAIRLSGDVVGELAAVDGGLRSSTVVSAGRTIARVIDGPLFRAFQRTHPEVAAALQRTISAKLRAATQFRVAVGSAPVIVRLARVLGYLAESYGRRVVDGIVIDIPISQADLAALIGVSRPAVTRAIAELVGQDGIRPEYRKIVVRDARLLRRIAGDA